MEKILCACGCGTLIDAYDKRGRSRRYVQWHGTRNPSEGTRKKMRDARLGTHMSDVSKRKVSEANKGRQRTEEVKKKMSESRTGEKNHFFGKKHTKSTKKKISNAMKGEVHNKWSKESREKIRKALMGKEFSEEHKKHMCERHTNVSGEKNPFYGKHHSEGAKRMIGDKNRIHQQREDIKQRQREKRRKQVIPNHHTQPELIFDKICLKYGIPFHYVGDSSLWIGKTKMLNPDFCELNGKKIVVEIFGDYWHSLLLNPKLRENATMGYRKKHYKKYGYKSVFIWERDLKRDDAEQFVLALLEKEVGIHATKGVEG